MVISLVNVNVYKRVTSTQFSQPLLNLLFLKITQSKIILIPKRHILGWQVWFSFNVLCTPRVWSLGVPEEGKKLLPQEMLSQSILILDKAAAQDTEFHGWTAPALGPYLRDTEAARPSTQTW